MTHIERLQESGIRRVATGKNRFTYRHADGRPVDEDDLDRCRALRLPPAWQDVAISTSATANLQAIGRDKAGRWQYRYHERHVQRRERDKYARLVAFAEALPKLRAAVARDLAAPGLGRDKVLACVVEILSTCFVRPGSQVYADQNGSFGLATLRANHVRVHGDTVELDFPGKSGRHQNRMLRNRRIAAIVRGCLKLPGREVFKYVGEDGSIVDVRRRDVNAYIKQVMGHDFSAKDFRTWAGTLVCACSLARAGCEPGDGRRARKRKVVDAVKETASLLGNTPAICRASYIFPSVLSSFDRGRTLRPFFTDNEELVAWRGPRLHACERALLELLREDAGRAPPRRRPAATPPARLAARLRESVRRARTDRAARRRTSRAA